LYMRCIAGSLFLAYDCHFLDLSWRLEFCMNPFLFYEMPLVVPDISVFFEILQHSGQLRRIESLLMI